jgi:hypothetical protein
MLALGLFHLDGKRGTQFRSIAHGTSQFIGRMLLKQDDDAVVLTLVEHFGGRHHALTGTNAFVFIDMDFDHVGPLITNHH